MAVLKPEQTASAEAAESLFYDAFQNADLEAMMAIWDDSDDIVCIHPMSDRLSGPQQIEQSWTDIFQYSPPIRISLTNIQRIVGSELAIHIVHENIHVEGEPQAQPPVIATNVFRRTSAGWRLVMHHASGLATRKREQTPPPQPPPVLH